MNFFRQTAHTHASNSHLLAWIKHPKCIILNTQQDHRTEFLYHYSVSARRANRARIQPIKTNKRNHAAKIKLSSLKPINFTRLLNIKKVKKKKQQQKMPAKKIKTRRRTMKNKNNNFQYIEFQFSFRFNFVFCSLFTKWQIFRTIPEQRTTQLQMCGSQEREIDVNVYNAPNVWFIQKAICSFTMLHK